MFWLRSDAEGIADRQTAIGEAMTATEAEAARAIRLPRPQKETPPEQAHGGAKVRECRQGWPAILM
jgi:hypothetical protein